MATTVFPPHKKNELESVVLLGWIHGSCQQHTLKLNLKSADINNVIFPDDYTLTCEETTVSLSESGQPILDGIIIENGTYCDLSVGFSDDTLNVCGFSEIEIIRTWSVKDLCTDFTVSADQSIFFNDDEAPEIDCPENITVNTNAGDCFATVLLPAPTLSDNCDAAPGFSVNTSWGEVGLGPHSFVPIGTHSIIYTALDGCGNFTNCFTTLVVEDIEEPTAVCEQSIIV